jgi:hypothetical protein
MLVYLKKRSTDENLWQRQDNEFQGSWVSEGGV